MDVAILDEEDELTAYVTIDGVVHGCHWLHYGNDWADIVVICTGKMAPNNTRTAKNVEAITCVACLHETFRDRGR